MPLAWTVGYSLTQLPVFRRGEVVGPPYDREIPKTALADPGSHEKPVESLAEIREGDQLGTAAQSELG